MLIVSAAVNFYYGPPPIDLQELKLLFESTLYIEDEDVSLSRRSQVRIPCALRYTVGFDIETQLILTVPRELVSYLHAGDDRARFASL